MPSTMILYSTVRCRVVTWTIWSICAAKNYTNLIISTVMLDHTVWDHPYSMYQWDLRPIWSWIRFLASFSKGANIWLGFGWMFSSVEKGIRDVYHVEEGSLSFVNVTYALVDYNIHALKLKKNSYFYGCHGNKTYHSYVLFLLKTNIANHSHS